MYIHVEEILKKEQSSLMITKQRTHHLLHQMKQKTSLVAKAGGLHPHFFLLPHQTLPHLGIQRQQQHDMLIKLLISICYI